MFRKQSPAKSLLTLALLANVVIGLPTNPTVDRKDDEIVKTEQTFYSVSCVHAGWGPASHCGAHCTSAAKDEAEAEVEVETRAQSKD
ncbi:hypothetical protein FLONG3_1087 [Fusarium longipes]|uniref:Uncharacterized protein n=1 Tax=Fusarium longipes TaxID=694270 RepID=A0A395T8B6_9HYPO|nr:hypothetical protein FLONG3_1087 [Fusarium longipes]